MGRALVRRVAVVVIRSSWIVEDGFARPHGTKPGRYAGVKRGREKIRKRVELTGSTTILGDK